MPMLLRLLALLLCLAAPALRAQDVLPVWSITRADSAGTGSTSCARSAGAARHSSNASRRSSIGMAAAYLDAEGAAGVAGLSKLTLGGALISASLATVKLGLTP